MPQYWYRIFSSAGLVLSLGRRQYVDIIENEVLWPIEYQNMSANRCILTTTI